MTVPLIEVETLDLVEAARMLRLWAAEPMEAAVQSLWGALDGCAGMAGTDPGGGSWGLSYDQAATVAVNAAADAVNGVDRLAALVGQTARNYEAADAASTPATRRVIDASVATLPCFGGLILPGCTPASAVGGSGGGPPGWGMVSHLVGYMWPNGHQDRLHAAAAAWRRSAAALEHGADDVVSAVSSVVADRLPEADDMWTVCSSVAGHLRSVASVHRSLGDACVELAEHLDHAHAEAIGELQSLVAWSAGIQGAGALLSVVTFGFAEAPTRAAQAARIAKTAAVVAAIIEKFIAATRTLAASVAAVVERAEIASARLRVVLGARLVEPALAGVGPMRMLNEAREVRAMGRIVGGASNAVRTFADRAAARRALPGKLGAACNRFFRGATSKCQDFRISPLPNGGYRMQFFAPARNAGYGKLYVQEIDAEGVMIKEYKDTIGPTGLIERKWTHEPPQ